MKRAVVRLWRAATYRDGPPYPPPERPAARPQVTEWEGELLLCEVDPVSRRVRIATVRRPGRGHSRSS